ncbi:Sec-independent protein translocase subunit TatA [Nocardioides jensenii]|uniref:Sec-independent protein translocase subunit TatA n=1 Tax=Nocardioides jensenii TaxID=1843 RepID=UPI00082AF911|nr:Sec-independent protein translocase subunit TatA [Nocardioides jensenii]
MFSRIGPLEITLILLIVVLLFGAKKLPELARGTGRALRIFKSETKGLMTDDDEDEDKPAASAPPGELPTPEKRPEGDSLKSEHRPDTTN